MPNYEYRPDKFHLFVPMLVFYIALISQLIWSIIEKIKKKKNYLNILMIVISILLFSILNNPKGSLQNTSYCGLIIISIVSIILAIIENKKESATKTIPKV
jgi:hypothetical membrane protein